MRELTEQEQLLSDAVGNRLTEIYDEKDIKTGDISPEQSLLWDDLIIQMHELFEDLIEQNSDEEADNENLSM